MSACWCAVAMISPKFPENVGSVLRSAHAFGVDAVFIVGARKQFRRHATDTSNAAKHINVTYLPSAEDLLAEAARQEADLVLVEVGGPNIATFRHPRRSIYVVGPEDGSINVADFQGRQIVSIDTAYCLNVAVAASLAIFSRRLQIR